MTIEERLEAVERELATSQRRTKLLLVSLGLAGMAFALVLGFMGTTGSAHAQGAGKEIRAKKFIVVDENDKPLGGLVSDNDGAMLALYNRNGNPGTIMNTAKITIYDVRSRSRVQLGASDPLTYKPFIWLQNEKSLPIWIAP